MASRDFMRCILACAGCRPGSTRPEAERFRRTPPAAPHGPAPSAWPGKLVPVARRGIYTVDMSQTRTHLSAGVAVLREAPAGRLFLLLRAWRYWDFPKGAVEPGETPLQAAIREVREET
ncbi:MAG: NUDIX domain-containing protein, partial [Gammaproteobacteria bacterium]